MSSKEHATREHETATRVARDIERIGRRPFIAELRDLGADVTGRESDLELAEALVAARGGETCAD
jgi:hypothetical protein